MAVADDGRVRKKRSVNNTIPLKTKGDSEN